MPLYWVYKPFTELTPTELYSAMQLRNEVFVVEQNCVYQDADNKDLQSFHLLGYNEQDLAAYCRILPPGLAYEDASIGRIVTSPKYRGFNYGKVLVRMAIEKTINQFNISSITIGAQLYLKNFYESFGFVQISNTYLEDGIPHIKMQLNR